MVSPEDLDPIIDSWAASIKQHVVGSSTSVKTTAAPTKAKRTPASSGDLSWPDGYEESVTHLYKPTLQKILPEDSSQRQRFIDVINNNTPEGDSLVNELAQTIVKQAKRNLAFDKVLAGLKAKIAEM